MDLVSAVECRSYEPGTVYDAVVSALTSIGYEVPGGRTVLIKPNVMSQNRPEQHTVTHFAVVAALCRLLAEHGCRVQIGDSEAFFERGMTRRAFRTTRLDRVASRFGATLIPFEEQPLVGLPTGLPWLDTLYLPQAVVEADVVINAPKLKSHSGLRLSGALKNMFGCVPGGYKQWIHRWSSSDFELSDVFVALHRLVPPAVSVMDAVVALDGGPAAIGRGVPTGRILASTSAAALDVVACRMIGYDPGEVSTLERARAAGLIRDYDEVDVVGSVERANFRRLPRGDIPLRKGSDGFLVTATYVDVAVGAACDGCGLCLGSCPVDAIVRDGARVAVREQLCINCYHCLTVCPRDALRARPSAANLAIRGVRTLVGI